MNFLIMLIVGGIAGWLASMVMRTDGQQGIILNVVVGIVWQLGRTALPIYLVLRNWPWVGAILAILAATSIYLKFNWYDKLEKAPALAPTPATETPITVR